MTVPKKFDRPVPREPGAEARSGKVRRIQMAREGHALEGAYASFASADALRLAPYESQRREFVSAGVKAWIALVLFWSAIAMILSTFVFAR